MPDEQITEPQDQQTDDQQAADQTDDRPSDSSESPDEIERLKQEQERLREEADRARQLAEIALRAPAYTSIAQDEARKRPAPPPDEDDEIDWSDPDSVKLALKRQREYFERKLEEKASTFATSYTSVRAQDEARWAELNRQRFLDSLAEEGLLDLADEVEKQIREWGLDPSALARPDAYDSVANYLIGKRERERRRNARRRSPNLASSTSSAETPSTPSLSPEESHYLDRVFRGKVDADDLKFFESDIVSYEDYKRFKESKRKAN